MILGGSLYSAHASVNYQTLIPFLFRTLVERVTDSYRPDAEALCRHILASLKSATEHEDDSRGSTRNLVSSTGLRFI